MKSQTPKPSSMMNRGPSSSSSPVAEAGWWSQLFWANMRPVLRNERSSRQKSAEFKFASTSADTATARTASSHSSSSSLADDDDTEAALMKRNREHRDLLQAALLISRDSAAEMRTEASVRPSRMAPPVPAPSRPHPHQPLKARDASVALLERRSRSPVLPVRRPWWEHDPSAEDAPAPSAAGDSSSQSSSGHAPRGPRPYRHRYNGDFCCPGCDEEASARAEEMYSGATWRMYDRITRARAATAARAQAQAQARLRHQVPLCVPVPSTVDVVPLQGAPLPPLPPLPRVDNRDSQGEGDQDEEEEEDDASFVFSLDMDQ